jgi:hypothetical protein
VRWQFLSKSIGAGTLARSIYETKADPGSHSGAKTKGRLVYHLETSPHKKAAASKQRGGHATGVARLVNRLRASINWCARSGRRREN